MRIEGEAEGILDQFMEGFFELMLDHHRTLALEMGLTLPQAQALRLLDGSPLATSRLARSLGISAPAVSQLTDRLVRKELIERRGAEVDRRSVMVVLTMKGKRLIDRSRERRNQAFEQALSRLGDQDQAEVLEVLVKIVRVLDEAQPASDEIRKRKIAKPEAPLSRTAAEQSYASNKLGPVTNRPAKRMKIEWD
ncbi:MAG: MarR family transcriptional regulator [Blastocatellia bacterium]